MGDGAKRSRGVVTYCIVRDAGGWTKSEGRDLVVPPFAALCGGEVVDALPLPPLQAIAKCDQAVEHEVRRFWNRIRTWIRIFLEEGNSPGNASHAG